MSDWHLTDPVERQFEPRELYSRRVNDPRARERIQRAEREYLSSPRKRRMQQLAGRICDQPGGEAWLARVRRLGVRP